MNRRSEKVPHFGRHALNLTRLLSRKAGHRLSSGVHSKDRIIHVQPSRDGTASPTTKKQWPNGCKHRLFDQVFLISCTRRMQTPTQLHFSTTELQLLVKWTQHPDRYLMISYSAVRVSAQRFLTRSRHQTDTSNGVFICCYWSNFGTTLG